MDAPPPAPGRPETPAREALDRGLALMGAGRTREALDSLRRAVELAPNLAEAHARLGWARMAHGEYPAAVASLRRAVELAPEEAAYLTLLGASLGNAGDLDGAREVYDRILARDPRNDAACTGKAVILERQGAFQAAYDLIEPLLERDAAGYEVAYVLADLARPLGREAEAAALVERALAGGPALAPEQRRTLHFKAGDLHDRLGDYEAAFGHYAAGNGMNPPRFDLAAFSRQVDRTLAAFSPEAMARLPRATRDGRRAVFILGMPRSGTSLTEQILASHPEVHGGGELRALNQVAHLMPATTGKELAYPECVAKLTGAVADLLAGRYLAALGQGAGEAERVTDKMPQNFMHLGLVPLLLPGARILHCVRDPMDTCLSCYTQDFADQHPYSTDLAGLGAYYREYQRLMDHWTGTLAIPVKEVRYEDLVADPEAVSRDLVAYLGLPWDDACLHFHTSTRAVHTASRDQVRQPVYTRSVARWRRYADHLGPLREALGIAP